MTLGKLPILVFVGRTIENEVPCKVTAGISDHLAVVLSLLNVPPTSSDRVQFYPNLFWADDEAIVDALDLHYDTFPKSVTSIIYGSCLKIHRYVPKIAKKRNITTPGLLGRRYNFSVSLTP